MEDGGWRMEDGGSGRSFSREAQPSAVRAGLGAPPARSIDVSRSLRRWEFSLHFFASGVQARTRRL
jgi:hypothetical protein